jgi:germination protein M
MPKKIICLIIIFILITSATGCGLLRREPPQEEVPEPEENNEQTLAHLRKTVFYFVNEHNLLVPVTRDIPWVEGIGRATLEILVDREELRTSWLKKV